jgi:hypothetical protein
MKFNLADIKRWPLTTNKITIEYDKEKFFSTYSVVSYYSIDKEYKNLAYEQLADIPFISVCGIRAKWNDVLYPCTRFFIMVKKGEASAIINSLREYDQIRFRIDDLEDYTPKQQQRIIASLAINSLGQMKADRLMYNNGNLLICDDKNFLIPKSKKELVCLKIEVNDFLILTAKTTSFSSPKSYDELKKKNCVFQVSEDIHGQWWSGLAIRPIILRKIKGNYPALETLYVQKKRFPDKHNIVPYWPYNPEDYSHGRLFALSQIVDLVNTKYAEHLRIEFVDSSVIYYDAYKPDKDMLRFLTEYLAGKSIFIDNPFRKDADALITQMKAQFQSIMQDRLIFHKKQAIGDLVVKLCEPKDEEISETHYTKSLYRLANSGSALQHKIFYNDEKEDVFSISEARRILMELLVKDCIIKRTLPNQFGSLADGWEFIRYKIHDDSIIGASLRMEPDGEMRIKDYGFSGDQPPIPFASFAAENLCYTEPEKIHGSRDYLALKKDGNVYLIIDTDEIPILDVQLIDDAYNDIVNGDMPLSFFKRKDEAHKYLRGYIGLHLWQTEGLNGEPNGAYSYISGTNSENMQILKSAKMDRMPRVRKVFILHKEDDTVVENQTMQIMDMLRFGFGRWNEMMTYPFPFKFLQEYLDDACEVAFSKHWSEITAK